MWQFNCKFVHYKFLIEIFNQAIAIAAFYFDSRFHDISTKIRQTISWKNRTFSLFFRHWFELLQIRWQIVEHEIEFDQKEMYAFFLYMRNAIS